MVCFFLRKSWHSSILEEKNKVYFYKKKNYKKLFMWFGDMLKEG